MKRWNIIISCVLVILFSGLFAQAALHPVTNFGKGTVSQGYDSVATSIVLQSGQGARFPATFPYPLVWYNATDYGDPADDPNVEIVNVTTRSTDTLTVQRGQEGTAPVNHNTAGKTYKMILSITKAMWDQIGTDITTGTGGINDVVDCSAHASCNAAVTAIGSARKTLRVSRGETIDSNLSIPSNIDVWIIGSGKFTVSSGVTITFNSPEQIKVWNRQRLFDGLALAPAAFTLPGTIYPGWWGAVTDDGNDDATAMQRAHDSLPSTGGTISLPAGRYTQNGELLVTKADIKIRMEPGAYLDIVNIVGTGTTGVHVTATVLAAIKTSGARTRVIGGRITGTISFQSKNLVGVLAHGSAFTRISGTKFDTLYSGIWAGNGATDLLIANVEVDACSRNILLGYMPLAASNPQVSRVTVLNANSHGSTGGDGIKFHAHSRDVSIVGGHYYGNFNNGIDGYVAGERMIIQGTHAYSNTQGGIKLHYGADTGEGANKQGFGRRNIVQGNIVRNNGTFGIAAEVEDYSVHSTIGGLEEVLIQGNISEGNGTTGYTLGLVRSSIIGNLARANTGDGFSIKSNADVAIVGNQAWDNGTTSVNKQGYVFRLASTTGPTPPKSQRITFQDNVGGDTRSGASRSQQYTYDMAQLQDSLVTGNIGNNSITADWGNVQGLTNVSFFNNRGAVSASDVLGAQIAKHLSGTVTWDPPDLATAAQATTTVTVTGAAIGDTCAPGFSLTLSALQLTCYVSAADTVTAVVQNGTGGNVNLGSGTLRTDVWKH